MSSTHQTLMKILPSEHKLHLRNVEKVSGLVKDIETYRRRIQQNYYELNRLQKLKINLMIILCGLLILQMLVFLRTRMKINITIAVCLLFVVVLFIIYISYSLDKGRSLYYWNQRDFQLNPYKAVDQITTNKNENGNDKDDLCNQCQQVLDQKYSRPNTQ